MCTKPQVMRLSCFREWHGLLKDLPRPLLPPPPFSPASFPAPRAASFLPRLLSRSSCHLTSSLPRLLSSPAPHPARDLQSPERVVATIPAPQLNSRGDADFYVRVLSAHRRRRARVASMHNATFSMAKSIISMRNAAIPMRNATIPIRNAAISMRNPKFAIKNL